MSRSNNVKQLLLLALISAGAGSAFAGGERCAALYNGTSAAKTIQRITVSWDEIRKNPATVEVVNMEAVSLAPGKGKDSWVRVPEQFTAHPTRVFQPNGPVNGVADYKVTSGGYLVVACNYDYQGNSSGDWTKNRWTRQDFHANGWLEATAEDLGGTLVNGQNREQAIFVKKVDAGETGRLRSNKYDPPYFILCSNPPAR